MAEVDYNKVKTIRIRYQTPLENLLRPAGNKVVDIIPSNLRGTRILYRDKAKSDYLVYEYRETGTNHISEIEMELVEAIPITYFNDNVNNNNPNILDVPAIKDILEESLDNLEVHRGVYGDILKLKCVIKNGKRGEIVSNLTFLEWGSGYMLNPVTGEVLHKYVGVGTSGISNSYVRKNIYPYINQFKMAGKKPKQLLGVIELMSRNFVAVDEEIIIFNVAEVLRTIEVYGLEVAHRTLEDDFMQ